MRLRACTQGLGPGHVGMARMRIMAAMRSGLGLMAPEGLVRVLGAGNVRMGLGKVEMRLRGMVGR